MCLAVAVLVGARVGQAADVYIIALGTPTAWFAYVRFRDVEELLVMEFLRLGFIKCVERESIYLTNNWNSHF